MLLVGVDEGDTETINKAIDIMKQELLNTVINYGKCHLKLNYKSAADHIVNNGLTLLLCYNHENLRNIIKWELYQYIEELEKYDLDALVVLYEV